MSRRASLPGAEELFRRTAGEPRSVREGTLEARREEAKATGLQVAAPSAIDEAPQKKAPKHDEKVTFYCTKRDLMGIEQARLRLRGEYGVAADRGRIVRAALEYVLEDFDARGEDSILLRRLGR